MYFGLLENYNIESLNIYLRCSVFIDFYRGASIVYIIRLYIINYINKALRMSQYGYYEGMSSSVLYVERFSSITRAR